MIRLNPSAQHRILIVRLSALGDVAYALPALSALRRHCPHAFLAWAVEEEAAGLVEGHPQLDEVIVVPRKTWQKQLKWAGLGVVGEMWHLRRELRSKRFEIAIDFQGNLRSALVCVASRTRHTVGFAPPCSREHSHLLMSEVAAVDPTLHKVRRNLALLEAMGVPAAAPEAVFPPPSEEDTRAIDVLLKGLGVSSAFVLMHPGVSRFGAYKQWPGSNYAQLALRLMEQGAAVLLSAGPGEEALVEAIAAQAEGAHTAKGLKLTGLMELMRRAAVFVGSDTGPTQMAWLLGTPAVALMGPKDPALYGPLGSRHRKLTADLPCRPCNRRKCRSNRCMTEIAVQDVLDAAVSIMKR